jgi:hypothetical protein
MMMSERRVAMTDPQKIGVYGVGTALIQRSTALPYSAY